MTKNKILTPNEVIAIAREESDMWVEIGKGNVPGYGFEFFSGDCETVGTSETIVRDLGDSGDYPFPEPDEAAQWFVQSTDANDVDVTGTGARTILLQLLVYEPDVSINNEVIEVVPLNGLTSVQIQTTSYRLQQANTLTAGSTFRNQGQITITTLTGGTGDILGSITALEGTMRQPIRTVPNGETWYPFNFFVTSGKGDDVNIRTVAFTPFPIPFRTKQFFGKSFLFESTYPFVNDTKLPFPESFDLQVLAVKSGGSTSGRIGTNFEFLTVRNNTF